MTGTSIVKLYSVYLSLSNNHRTVDVRCIPKTQNNIRKYQEILLVGSSGWKSGAKRLQKIEYHIKKVKLGF